MKHKIISVIAWLSVQLLVCNNVQTIKTDCEVRLSDGTHVPVFFDPEIMRLEEEKIEQAKIAMSSKQGLKLDITTDTDVSISAIYFDRGSNNLLVVGQGIGDPKEHMLFYARIFHDYDVLIFDYRWCNIKNFLFNRATLFHPIESVCVREKEEVLSIVQLGKSLKNYTKVIGLGVCYSAYMFVAAQHESQAQGKALFDALILDSCPFSISDIAKQVCIHPSLVCNPRASPDQGLTQKVLSFTRIHYLVGSIAAFFVPYSTVSMFANLSDIPLLFIHGNKDSLVPLSSFDAIWASVQSKKKMALITPNAHVMNIKNKVIYKLICEQFISEL